MQKIQKKRRVIIIEEEEEETNKKNDKNYNDKDVKQHEHLPNKFSEFLIYSETENQKINIYLHTLSPIEIQAIKIAKDHLKSSFSITRSNDYNDWKKKNNV